MDVLRPETCPRVLWIKLAGMMVAGYSFADAALIVEPNVLARLEDEIEQRRFMLDINSYEGLPEDQIEVRRNEALAGIAELQMKMNAISQSQVARGGPISTTWSDALAELLLCAPSTVEEWARVSHSGQNPPRAPNVGKLHAIYGAVLGHVEAGEDCKMYTATALTRMRQRGWTQAGLAKVLDIPASAVNVHLRGQKRHEKHRPNQVTRELPVWFALALRTLLAGEPVPAVFYRWARGEMR